MSSDHFHSPWDGSETIFAVMWDDGTNPNSWEQVSLCTCGQLVLFSECGHGYISRVVAPGQLLETVKVLRKRAKKNPSLASGRRRETRPA